MVHNRIPDYSSLKIFGCECWPNLRPYNKHRMQFRSKSCLFLGYYANHKGYKRLDVTTNRLYISRDVTFNEFSFPFSKSRPIPSLYTQTVPQAQLPLFSSSILGPGPTSPTSSSSQHSNPSTPSVSPATSISSLSHDNPLHSSFISQPAPILVPPRSPIITRASTHSSRPCIATDEIVPYHCESVSRFTTTPTSSDTSTSFFVAFKFPGRRDAMSKEFSALTQIHTRSLVPPNPSSNILGCRWVY